MYPFLKANTSETGVLADLEPLFPPTEIWGCVPNLPADWDLQDPWSKFVTLIRTPPQGTVYSMEKVTESGCRKIVPTPGVAFNPFFNKSYEIIYCSFQNPVREVCFEW